MDGFYIDDDCCGKMITRIGEGEWNVDGAVRGDVEHDHYTATIRLEEFMVRIVYSSTHEVKGMYDGRDTLIWADGKKWKRLALSSKQIYTLRRRPYVPITLLASHFIYIFVSWLFKCIGGTRAKTMRALMSWRAQMRA